MAVVLLGLLVLSLLETCVSEKVCVVGSGMAGASTAYFLRSYGEDKNLDIEVFERHSRVGGRMATVELAGDTFEAGASILHPKNLHAVRFVELLGLKRNLTPDSDSFGIWDGQKFVLKTRQAGDSVISRKVTELYNNLAILWRYGASLFKMQSHVTVRPQQGVQHPGFAS